MPIVMGYVVPSGLFLVCMIGNHMKNKIISLRNLTVGSFMMKIALYIQYMRNWIEHRIVLAQEKLELHSYILQKGSCPCFK